MAAETHDRALPAEPNHRLRFTVAWLVASVVTTVLAVFWIGPKMPPGEATSAASGQVTDNTVLLALAMPIVSLVLVYLVYAVIYFRQPRGAALEGPAVRGDAKIQLWWIVSTSILVLTLAIYGTARLVADDGEGSGSGPNPLTVPKGPKLKVQVIAQQWYFTYRWPQYGGVETTNLVLPVDKMVEFNVTSLDVIHSFWAFQLGVKADANPQVNNIAFSEPTKEMGFEVRCAELCGLWHGEMSDTHNKVVSQTAFESWIAEEQTKNAAGTKLLPPYSVTYQPEPARRGG